MIEAPEFYNENDPIIRMARDLQHGKPLEKIPIEELLNTAQLSQYAQTLSKAFIWIREASRFFMREINEDKEYLFNNFNIAENQKIERY